LPALTALELLRQRASIREFTIEESVTCSIQGEDPVEKLIDGQYTLLSSAIMVDRRYVAAPARAGQ
jgi:hypothetical protein